MSSPIPAVHPTIGTNRYLVKAVVLVSKENMRVYLALWSCMKIATTALLMHVMLHESVASTVELSVATAT